MSKIIERVGTTKNMKPLPQVVMCDETRRFKIKAAMYDSGTSIQIIDTSTQTCVSMGVDVFESFLKRSEELLERTRQMEVRLFTFFIKTVEVLPSYD